MTNSADSDRPASVATTPQSAAQGSAQKLSSQELFRHSTTVCIEHQGEHYWLRLTRGNKLILTK